ncbi:MAG: SsrA-binding protein SmpB [Candidatus Wallbacteria bacterium]|nr:SsrA-binding protein SmpB [Candidatus Wallbacteria bacterium]
MKHEQPALSIRNKRVWAEYSILERFEAGIELLGSEVKSIRAHNCSFSDAFVLMRGEEAYLENFHIGEYAFAGHMNHEPRRSRRLLLKKAELRQLIGKVQRQGLTIVPLALFAKGRWLKLEIGLARGKKLHDKRQDIAKRDTEREVRRALKERSR